MISPARAVLHHDADAVYEVARSQWISILLHFDSFFFGDACQRVGHHVSCPIHGGKDGFRLYPDANDTGGGCCNTCGPFANGFALLMKATGKTFCEVVDMVGDYLGMERGARPSNPSPATNHPKQDRPTAPPVNDHPEHRKKLFATWDKAKPDPLLQVYFCNRGLSLTPPGSLRLIRNYEHYEQVDGKPVVTGRYPTMVAQMVRVDGTLVALHRTYLAADGAGKADVPSPKKLTSSPTPGYNSGAAIRLYDATDHIAIVEGIETGLAVHQITGIPVWAAYSATNLERVQLPENVRNVDIWGDSGEPGERSANKAAARFAQEGRTVRVMIPHGDYSDWLDVLVAEVAHA